MINKASDYKYVTGLDNFIINGEIMPLRTGSAADAIRGEDLAFIAEARSEISNDVGITLPSLALDNKITWNQADTVLNWYQRWPGFSAYNPDAPLYNGMFAQYTPSSDPNENPFMDALGLTYVELPHPFPSYPYIRKEDVAKHFERIEKARRIDGGLHYDSIQNVDWTNRNEGNAWPEGTGTWTTWNTAQYIRYVESHGSGKSASGSPWKWTQQGRYWSAPRGRAMNFALPADYRDVWQLWDFTARIEKFTVDGTYDETRNFALVTNPDVDWYELSRTHANAVLNSFGVPYIDTYADSENGAVWIRDAYYMKHYLAEVYVYPRQLIVDVSNRIRW